jgi:hypothetical protein
MDAALWSAIAIVAALSTGTLFVVIAKIDALASRLDGRIDASSASSIDTSPTTRADRDAATLSRWASRTP